MSTIAVNINRIARTAAGAALALLFTVSIEVSHAQDNEVDPAVAENAKMMLKAMSDYVGGQQTVSFDFEAVFEVVTREDQKLALVSSGAVELARPDKLHARRSGGFADVEMFFDGQALTLVGKHANLFTRIPVDGSIDDLMDAMSTRFNRPVPAADLLTADSYGQLIEDVTDIKDLGSGVVNGVECDHLAFRTEGVDWQIWIAQGDRPYPCRYSITSKTMALHPPYSITIRNWNAGDQLADGAFVFANDSNAEEIDPKDLEARMSELPSNFKRGD